MAKSAKPASAPPPASEARQGVVASVEKRATKAGNPMLVLTVDEERISFFESEDVAQPVAIGDAVTFSLTRKGSYLNGKGLAVVPKGPAASQPAPEAPPKPAAPQSPPAPQPAPRKLAPGERPALHELDEAQLLALYAEESAATKVEPARLGQISNQVRYARIEALLREILAVLQKNYLGKKTSEY